MHFPVKYAKRKKFVISLHRIQTQILLIQVYQHLIIISQRYFELVVLFFVFHLAPPSARYCKLSVKQVRKKQEAPYYGRDGKSQLTDRAV